MKLNSQSDKIIKSRLFFEFNVSVYLRTDCYLFKYMNWTSSIMFVQSQFSQVKLFFIKFDEIFLIKGIVIESLVQINSLSFPFVKKTLKNWSNHYVWYFIPKQANTIERTFQVLYPLFAKIMFSFKVHQFWIHRYWDNYTDSNFKSSEVRNLS